MCFPRNVPLGWYWKGGRISSWILLSVQRTDPCFVVMFRRHSLVRIYWTKVSRAGSRGWNQAYWRRGKARQRGSTPPPASWTPHLTLCSAHQPRPSTPGQQEHVRTHYITPMPLSQTWPYFLIINFALMFAACLWLQSRSCVSWVVLCCDWQNKNFSSIDLCLHSRRNADEKEYWKLNQAFSDYLDLNSPLL